MFTLNRSIDQSLTPLLLSLQVSPEERTGVEEALARLDRGASTEDLLLPFGELCDVVGFTEYNAEAARYATET